MGNLHKKAVTIVVEVPGYDPERAAKVARRVASRRATRKLQSGQPGPTVSHSQPSTSVAPSGRTKREAQIPAPNPWHLDVEL